MKVIEVMVMRAPAAAARVVCVELAPPNVILSILTRSWSSQEMSDFSSATIAMASTANAMIIIVGTVRYSL